jgi:hypothetical protein
MGSNPAITLDTKKVVGTCCSELEIGRYDKIPDECPCFI